MVHRFSPIRPIAALLLLAAAATACNTRTSTGNLALRHPARHSSAVDYDATAQLAVDGIVETQQPCRVEVCGNGGVPLSKIDHDIPFEPRPWTAVTVAQSIGKVCGLRPNIKWVNDLYLNSRKILIMNILC